VPVDFSVGFDPADIIDSHSYTVEATISSGDALLWTTDTAYPVITRGNPLTADLLLIALPSSVEQ
jgi:putative lipoprotein